MNLRVLRAIVGVICVVGIVGMIVGSVAENNNGVVITFGLITAVSVLVLMAVSAAVRSGGQPGAVDEELSQQEGSYRTLSFVMRDSTDSRSQGDSDWPDPAQVYLNNDVPYDRTKNMWIRKQERDYGYTAAADSAGGRDKGVFVLPFITDSGLQAGSEDRYKYLSVSAADTLGFRGVIGGSGTHKLTTMYNFVRPPGGNIRALTAR